MPTHIPAQEDETHKYMYMNQKSYTDSMMYTGPEHKECNISRNVVFQTKLIELWHAAPILLRTQMSGEKTTKLNQSVQTLQNNIHNIIINYIGSAVCSL